MSVAVVQVVGTGALEGTGGPDTQVQVSVPSIAAGSRLLAFHTRDVTNNATVTVTGGGGSWVNIGYAPSPSGTGDLNGEEVGAWYNDSPSTGTQTINFNFSGSGEQVTGGIVVELSGAATGSNWLSNHQQQTAPGTGTDAVGAGATVTPSVATGQLIGCGFNSNTNGAPNTGTANSPTSQGTFWSWVFSGGVLSARVQSQANAGTSAIASTFTCANGTRGAEDHISWTVLVTEPSAVVVQPPPDTSLRLGVPSRISISSMSSISGAAALLPLPAVPVVQFYPSQPDPLRRAAIQDRGAAGSAFPIVVSPPPPVGLSFDRQETLPRRPRALAALESGSGAPVSGLLSFPPLTWAVPSPVLVRRPSAADGGGGAITPLIPSGGWDPDAPMLARRRAIAEAPSWVPFVPTTQAVIQPQPDAAMNVRRRVPAAEAAPGWWWGPNAEPDLSWARQEDRPARRAIRSEDATAPAILPVFQSQAPTWMNQPADRPALRRVPLWPDAAHPAVLTVNTLSSWGWIPSVPERPGLRKVVFQPFSDRQDPILVAPLLTWGWLPSGPDKPAPRVVMSQPFSDRVNPITINTLSYWGWLPAGPDLPAARAVRSQDPAQVPGAPTALPAWGWSVAEDARARRPAIAWDASAVVPGPTASTWGWLPGAPDQRARRAPAFEAPSLAPGPIPGASLEWATQPSALAALARRPLHEQAQVVRALVVPGMEWLVHATNPIARRRQVEAPQAAVPQPAIVPLPPWWEPEPPRVVRRARIQPDDPQPPPGVLIIPPLLTMLLPHDPGRPARRVVLPVDFSVMPGGVIAPPPPVVLRLFTMAGAVSADVARVYFGDGSDADA